MTPWAALKGRRALKVEWTRGPFAQESSATLDAQCTALLKGKGQRVREDGDFDRARASAARVVRPAFHDVDRDAGVIVPATQMRSPG